jgi:hypothetical protein
MILVMKRARLRLNPGLLSAALTMISASAVSAQTTASHSICGVDSVRGEFYRARLASFPPGNVRGAVVTWSNDKCAAGLTALRDALTQSGEEAYVYALKGVRDATRYAVVIYSDRVAKEGGEWAATVCFFDGQWAPLGVCLAI